MTAAEMRTDVNATINEMVERVGGNESRYAAKVREEMSGALAVIDRYEQRIVGEKFAIEKIADATEFTNRIINRVLSSK